jgi:hypothetical protein
MAGLGDWTRKTIAPHQPGSLKKAVGMASACPSMLPECAIPDLTPGEAHLSTPTELLERTTTVQ